jgi:hypothetical protein
MMDPQLRQVVEENPEIGQILREPAMLRQVSFHLSQSPRFT